MKVTDIKIDRLSDEQLKELQERAIREANKREVVKKLSDRDELKDFNKELGKVAKNLGVDMDDIRLAEMAAFTEDFPAFVVKVNGRLDEWKREHATYRDPDNPNNFWYSPDGAGNPPDWIKLLVGEKPKKQKGDKKGEHEKQMAKWLKKIEHLKVDQADEKQAA